MSRDLRQTHCCAARAKWAIKHNLLSKMTPRHSTLWNKPTTVGQWIQSRFFLSNLVTKSAAKIVEVSYTLLYRQLSPNTFTVSVSYVIDDVTISELACYRVVINNFLSYSRIKLKSAFVVRCFNSTRVHALVACGTLVIRQTSINHSIRFHFALYSL